MLDRREHEVAAAEQRREGEAAAVRGGIFRPRPRPRWRGEVERVPVRGAAVEAVLRAAVEDAGAEEGGEAGGRVGAGA